MQQREQIIRNYTDAYNSFDIEGMLRDFHQDIQFENIFNGEVNMRLNGIDAFRQQALEAKELFGTRRQTILAFNHREDDTEISIDYHGVLAIDLSEKLKKGDEMNLTGRSIFRFDGNRIIGITDIS